MTSCFLNFFFIISATLHFEHAVQSTEVFYLSSNFWWFLLYLLCSSDILGIFTRLTTLSASSRSVRIFIKSIVIFFEISFKTDWIHFESGPESKRVMAKMSLPSQQNTFFICSILNSTVQKRSFLFFLSLLHIQNANFSAQLRDG